MASAKNAVKTAIAFALRLFGRKRAIVFESTPDFADNTFAVFEQMFRQGLGEKYKLVWSCSKEEKLPKSYGKIYYIYPLKKGLWQRLRNAYYMANANCLICCNRFLKPWMKKQTSFYLTHGAPIKAVRGYFTMPPSIHYCLSPSEWLLDITAYELNVEKDKMFALGYPRNDVLTQPVCQVKKMLSTDCEKVIIWYPTFRQHKQKSGISCGNAMPIIHDAQAAQLLNERAKALGVLIVMKPHFAQDLSYIKDLGLSNIRFIDDGFFRQHNTTSYQFVAGCDAMLTDYSSTYFDYLLCDKPVGLIWEDIEAYRSNPGFAVDMDEVGKGASLIYTLDEFMEFVSQVAHGEDPHREARNALCDLVNYSKDGKNAQRVTQFIIEKSKL